MHTLQNYIAGWWNHRMQQIYLHLYCTEFFDQRQSCDVHANLQTANVIGKLTTNLGDTLIEKYSEIDNTETFLKQTNDGPGPYE